MNQQVHFNVGDVVFVLSHRWLGVIAGWDLHAKVPEVWINEIYKEFPHRVWQPHYVVLLDVGRVEHEAAYVGQVIIESRFMGSLWDKSFVITSMYDNIRQRFLLRNLYHMDS